jgi:peptide/nickel transport system permease protein/oligopeptide transport system permease protein
MSDQSINDKSDDVPRINEFKRFWTVFLGRGVVIFGAVVILITIFIAVFAPWVAPYDPYQENLEQILQKPSWEHPLGTDTIGRDTLSRIVYGSRISFMVGLVSVSIAASLGMTTGLIAGYFGGLTYTILMRFVDAMMAFPMMLRALLLAAVLGSGIKNVMLALGIGLMTIYARLMCGQVLTIRESDYVVAARASGASNLRIMLRHIAPNSFPPLIVMMTMQMGFAILAEAGLSFLGIGIETPTATWGSMVSDGYKHLYTNPVLSLAPGLAIMLLVLAFNMVGDGIRDAFDPKLRGTL